MKYYLSLVGIFKNEQSIIVEWIEHYLSEGVQHIYLIDNGSIDDYRSKINRYIVAGSVEVVVDDRPHMQILHYNNHYLKRVKTESEWVIVADLDEFIYSRKLFNKISDYLTTLSPNTSQVCIPWKLFGSNGHIKQPKMVIDSFTSRTLYNHIKTNGMVDAGHMLTKTIVRTKYLNNMGIHCSNVSSGTLEITSDGQRISKSGECHQLIDEKILKNSALHCNHYPIQSFDWFRSIKMSRGSANTVSNDKVRDTNYYNSFDSHSNQISDTELTNKRNTLQVYYGNKQYANVTREFCARFLNNNKITIDSSIILNNILGDPVPGLEKFLIIKYHNQIRVYEENKHGNIVLSIPFPSGI
jgi:hypothetical protein